MVSKFMSRLILVVAVTMVSVVLGTVPSASADSVPQYLENPPPAVKPIISLTGVYDGQSRMFSTLWDQNAKLAIPGYLYRGSDARYQDGVDNWALEVQPNGSIKLRSVTSRLCIANEAYGNGDLGFLGTQAFLRDCGDAGTTFFVQPGFDAGTFFIRSTVNNQCLRVDNIGRNVIVDTCLNSGDYLSRAQSWTPNEISGGGLAAFTNAANSYALYSINSKSSVIDMSATTVRVTNIKAAAPRPFEPVSEIYTNGTSDPLQYQLSWQKDLTEEHHWDVSATIGFEIGTGDASPVHAMFSTSITAGGGGSWSETNSAGTTLTATVNPGERAWVNRSQLYKTVTGQWKLKSDLGVVWSATGSADVPARDNTDGKQSTTLVCTSDSTLPSCLDEDAARFGVGTYNSDPETILPGDTSPAIPTDVSSNSTSTAGQKYTFSVNAPSDGNYTFTVNGTQVGSPASALYRLGEETSSTNPAGVIGYAAEGTDPTQSPQYGYMESRSINFYLPAGKHNLTLTFLENFKVLNLTFSSKIDGYGTTSTAAGYVPPGEQQVSRISGDSRYETSAAISQKAYPGTTDTVWLASGENYPDGLSAGPAANNQNAPLLLTAQASLPTPISAEIRRLKAKKVVIAGGTGSVSATVANQVKALGVSVVRVGGSDRYATSRAIMQYAFPDTESGYAKLFVATGLNWPDALAGTAAAAAQKVPLLLVPGASSSVDSETLNAIEKLSPGQAIVLGKSAVVSDGIKDQLAAYTDVKRYAGADRYGTARVIAMNEFKSPAKVYVASGIAFPDSLSGAVLAAKNGAPLYLAQPGCLTIPIWKQITATTVSLVTLLGGFAVLNSNVESINYC